ncbi:bifunctional ADP-dependent NAD(P)H-hydrate dehydratase/NAD(P)H-hydrate epimerase [Bacillus niameyensis]|uniref:bifunctional ADP-dependent NAD(P)H-hydrate dehydratase/NAD(P)H-hydrate epimerase n=1 Tax=Bacillus niameyensis TaxID=1522308 RepID=UPI000781DA85|nr:bifunctional ADP-dependent NAD(P)H-hydrate dehydratase/NAD(P)H-hydrate epimerase [Bacillus niameyensis]
MYIASQKEMQLMDQYTMEKIGLPGVVLMENAGTQVVNEIIADLPNQNPRVLILAGSGNNGGDGFVIARRLFDLGLDPLLCLLVNPNRIKGDAKVHFEVYQNRGLPIFYFQDRKFEKLQSLLDHADIIVDAILGTGVKGRVKEPVDQVITSVNGFAGKKMIISVDIPSGVSSDDGKVEGVAIQATKTISFVFPKRGFFLNDGPNYIGEWKVVDISVPSSIVKDLDLKMPQLITDSFVKSSLPIRPPSGHKGTFGHVLVIGGSRSYVGAPIFTAKAAFNSGAGLITLAVPESIYPIAASQSPESLLLPLAEKNGHFSETAISELSERLHQFDSIAIGPGISRFSGGEQWIKLLFQSLGQQSIVIDADALYLLRNHMDIIREYKGNIVFTPHPGEMATLLNMTVREVEERRLEIAENFAKDHKIYLLLKGHRSIIATPNGDVFINPHGHDALGKGGSGDVLTGMVASFLAQGATPRNAVISATYLHARAGEEKATTLSHYGVTPFDLIEGVREQLNIIL